VRLEPLYRVEFYYPEHYNIDGPDVGGVFLAEGRCEGFVSGPSAASITRDCGPTTSICPTSRA
jgi:hypothetical protein